MGRDGSKFARLQYQLAQAENAGRIELAVPFADGFFPSTTQITSHPPAASGAANLPSRIVGGENHNLSATGGRKRSGATDHSSRQSWGCELVSSTCPRSGPGSQSRPCPALTPRGIMWN
jgi:hypothetical protein